MGRYVAMVVATIRVVLEGRLTAKEDETSVGIGGADVTSGLERSLCVRLGLGAPAFRGSGPEEVWLGDVGNLRLGGQLDAPFIEAVLG